jgi:PAS domain S-box-containing protein
MKNSNRKTFSVKSILIVIYAVVIYWAVFAALHELFSVPPFPLTILPIVASSWFWGIKRGLLSGTFIILSSLFFIIIFNLHRNNPLTVILVVVISFILGSAAGWVRKLYDSEKMNSAILAGKHKELMREMEERKKADGLLKEHYNFSHLIYTISNKFINVLPENVQEVFYSSLQIVGGFLGMDSAFLYQLNPLDNQIEMKGEWLSERIEVNSSAGFRGELALWDSFKEELQHFESVIMPDLELMPEEKLPLKKFLQSRAIRSAILVPVISRNTVIGFLGFDSICIKKFPDDIQEMLKIISDIFANALTQQQKTEALLANEERFRLLVQKSADIIAVIDTGGRLKYTSEASVRILGSRSGEEKWTSVFQLLHHDDVSTFEGVIKDLQVNRTPAVGPIYIRVQHADGSWVYLEVMFTNQLDNPAIKGIVLNARDFTQHFALQEAFRNSRNFLNAIINCASDPMYVKDKGHKYLLVNDAFCNLTGYKRQEVLGKTAYELLPREEADDIFVKNEQAFNEETIKDFESIITDKGNIKHVIAVHLNVYKEASGEKYLIVNLRDETRRKELDEEINYALMKEKELSEMKSKFISMVSHEYRTPLTAILSSAELLELFGVDMTNDERMEHLRGIKKTVQYMTSMLNEVLLINRVESKRMDYTPTSFELIAFCKELLQRLGFDKEFEIKMNSDFTSRKVCMDEKLLGHILNNLLSNAVKYSPDGATVWLNITGNNGLVSFEIIDKGPGIPEEEQNRLFEPFFRANNVLNISGSGLGLSIVKYCTDLHKGSISFESKTGEGTRFFVSLPDESCTE